MGHAVNWFQISGSDGKSLQNFYKKVFAWKLGPSPGGDGMGMVAAEPGGIPGGIAAAMNGQSQVTVYVSVTDIDAHLKKISKAGGKPAMPKMELPAGMGFISGFIDPAGNWVGLWQAGAPPVAKRSRKPSPAAKKPAAKKPAAKQATAKKAAKKSAKAAAKAPVKQKASKKRRR